MPSSLSPAANATVVIPVYNDNDNLTRCLSALKSSTYGHFQVLIVDDGSTIPTQPIVEPYGYRYLKINGPGGPARARNRGVEQVETKYIIFIDADVCVHPDTIERFMQTFSDNPDLAAIIGSYDDTPAHSSFLSQYRNLLHHYTHNQSAGPVTTFWTGCGAVRKDVFLKYGGFDEKRYPRPMIEDIELGTWMAAGGEHLLLDPSIQCKHLKQWSFVNMVKTDLFQRGIVWIDLMLRSKKVISNLNVSWSQRASVALVFATVVFLILGLRWPVSFIALAVSLTIIIILNMRLYRFFASRRSLWFSIKAMPLHWLYFACCGVSVIAGTLQFYLWGGQKQKYASVESNIPPAK